MREECPRGLFLLSGRAIETQRLGEVTRKWLQSAERVVPLTAPHTTVQPALAGSHTRQVPTSGRFWKAPCSFRGKVPGGAVKLARDEEKVLKTQWSPIISQKMKEWIGEDNCFRGYTGQVKEKLLIWQVPRPGHAVSHSGCWIISGFRNESSGQDEGLENF